MAQRRRRQAGRRGLVFLGSLVAHVAIFAIVARELTIPYHLPIAAEPAIQLDLTPPPEVIIPPPPPTPPPKPLLTPKPQPPKPQPTPQPQPPQPQPQPAPTPAPPQPSPKVIIKRTAPAKVAINPTPIPAPNPAQVPSPLAPPLAAPQPGPPEVAPHAVIVASKPHVVAAPTLRLHKSTDVNASALAPPVSIPGAVFAAPSQAGGQSAGAGAPGGGGAGGLPGGALPGFGNGLRGSLLGCINQAIVKLTPEEQARCAERLGEGAQTAPAMDPIGASGRSVLDDEAAREQSAQRYRDNTTPGNAEHTIPDQPRLGHTPGGD